MPNPVQTYPQMGGSYLTADDWYEGEMNEAGVRELLKSLEANEGVTDVAQLKGASALQPQSLEATVVSLLFDESYFKALNRVPKKKEYSTLVEYTQRDSFGTFNTGGFMNQSENPRQADPSFRRRTEDIKFLRELWSVSSVLAASRTITNPEIESVDAATMRLLETAERGFFFANNTQIPEEWKGLDQVINERATGDSDVIIDLKGGGFTESILKEACKRIADRRGVANDMYVSYNSQNQIDNLLNPDGATDPRQRYYQNNGNLTFDLGHTIPGFRATFAKNGRVTFIPNFFINPEEEGVPTVPNNAGDIVEGATSELAPAMPTIDSIVDTALGAGETSEWKVGSAAPSGQPYQWRVAAENRHGLSKASPAVTQTITADQKAVITITDNSVNNFAEAYRIYREIETGTGTIRFMVRVAADSSGTTVVDDFNFDLPGTSVAYLGDFNSRGSDGPMRTCAMKELAPFHKTRYSIIGPFFWGAVNYYATPVFYAPQKFIKFKNVGVGLF